MTHALYTALSSPNKRLNPGTSFFSIATEATPGFLLSLITAPTTAGFTLEGLAVNSEEDIAQFWWRPGKPVNMKPAASPKMVIRQAVHSYLCSRGEPANYLSLFTASLAGLVTSGLLPQSIQDVSNDLMTRTQAALAELLEDRSFLIRYAGKTTSDEGGLWWLVNSEGCQEPLADRVEREIVTLLTREPEIWRQEVNEDIYKTFPGLLTPSSEFIDACLASYGEAAGNQPMLWHLSGQEQPAARRSDLKTAAGLLKDVANKLGFQSDGENPVIWQDNKGKPAYQFHLMASSQISRYVYEPQALPLSRCVLVLPGGRSTLLSLKLRRDPRLNAAVESGWHILKFRHLRQLASLNTLNHAIWDEMLDGDPPRWEEAVQPVLF